MTGGPRPGGSGPGSPWTKWSDDAEAEVAAELEAHFEGTVDLLVERGWTEEDARAEAERRFGDMARYRHTLERMAKRRKRRRRAAAVLRELGAALVSSARGLRRSPGISAGVVVTLALGIGANAAVFRVVDSLLLSPPEHVVRASEVRRLHQMISREPGELNAMTAFTYGDVRALRASDLPARFAAQVGTAETLGEGEGAERVRVARADSAYLPLLGVDATLGRAFTPDDHRASATPVALLGHALWTSRFGSDPDVLGRTLRLGDSRYELVGVLPEGFVGAERPAVDIWLPLEATAPDLWGGDWAQDPGVLAFHVLARVRPDTDQATLAGDARAVLMRSREDGYALEGTLHSVGTASLVPGDGPNPLPVVSVSRWLTGVALLVLLVACANVANLFLAQGERLRRETAVRLALGAGRRRITTELLARAVVLALLGAAGALALAAWGGGVLDELFLGGLELGTRPRNGRLLLFVGAAAMVAATLSGLLPALRAPGADLRWGLDGEGRSTTGRGALRRTLVAIQAALSAVLVVGALLFVMSLRAALRLDLGFDAERLVMVRIEAEEGEEPADLYRAGEEALLGASGVSSVTSTVAVPFVLLYGISARLPDADSPPTSPDGRLTVNAVGARFFETMGVPVLRGRPIEQGDLADGAEPVAVVSPAAARLLWPGQDPLGRCLIIGRGEAGCARVVGLAAEHAGTSFSLPDDPTAAAEMMAWVPLPVAGRASPSALLVRAQGKAGGAVEEVRRRMLTVGGVRYVEAEPLATFVDRQTRSWRLGATVFSLFGLIALAVAAVGLYGVLAYEVARRRREIGIRMALGARPGRVMGGVVLVALLTVGAGLAVALPTAAWGARRLGSLLFRVSPGEPMVFALAAGLLLATATLAAAVPAWRATRVDPREALAEE